MNEWCVNITTALKARDGEKRVSNMVGPTPIVRTRLQIILHNDWVQIPHYRISKVLYPRYGNSVDAAEFGGSLLVAVKRVLSRRPSRCRG